MEHYAAEGLVLLLACYFFLGGGGLVAATLFMMGGEPFEPAWIVEEFELGTPYNIGGRPLLDLLTSCVFAFGGPFTPSCKCIR